MDGRFWMKAQKYARMAEQLEVLRQEQQHPDWERLRIRGDFGLYKREGRRLTPTPYVMST